MAKAKSDKSAKPKKGKKQKNAGDGTPDVSLVAETEDATDAQADDVSETVSASPKVLRRVQKSAKRVGEAAARLVEVTEELEQALRGKAVKRSKN